MKIKSLKGPFNGKEMITKLFQTEGRMTQASTGCYLPFPDCREEKE